MYLARNLFGWLSLFLVIASTLNAQQANSNSTGWAADSSKIQTEHINIDFGSVQKLKSAQNVKQSNDGIQSDNPDQPAEFVSEEITVPVDTVAPFLAVGSRWIQDADQTESDDIQLQIRSAEESMQWSEWQTIDQDEHLTTSRDTLNGTLIYLPEPTRFLQYRVVLPGAEDPSILRSLRLSFTSPGATPPDTLQKIKEKAAGQSDPRKKSESRNYPMPEYVTRSEWGCPDGQEPSGSVSTTDVTHQIVHHSAGTNSSSDWPAVVRSIWDYHVNSNGWSDIGYNWLVDPNGVIYQGRGWIDGNDEVVGAHFCGTNSNTMGVCLLGNFEKTSPSSDALDNLEELLAWKSDEKNIDPTKRNYHSSNGLNLFTISGHQDGCSTECPGENLYIRLSEVRDNVKTKIGEITETEGELALEGNYPNPFSESTTINFSLEKPGNVRITIWNVAGRMIDEVSDQFYEADSHSETWDASGYASGVYFCRMEFEDQSMVKKMVLVK